jgi:hypothetical protein
MKEIITDKPLKIELDKCKPEPTASQFAFFVSMFRADIRSVFYASRMFREVAPISFQQVKDGQQEVRLTFADGSTFCKVEVLP